MSLTEFSGDKPYMLSASASLLDFRLVEGKWWVTGVQSVQGVDLLCFDSSEL